MINLIKSPNSKRDGNMPRNLVFCSLNISMIISFAAALTDGYSLNSQMTSIKDNLVIELSGYNSVPLL